MPTFEEIQQEIESMLDVPDENLTEEQRQAMDAYLDELAQLEADKVDAYAGFFKSAEARAKACREEAQRLQAKAKGIESRLLSAKERLLESMQKRGLKKLSGDVYTLSTRKTSRVDATEADLKFLLDEGFAKLIPAEIKPDLMKIGKELRDGKEIYGCRLVENASLILK